MNIKLVWEGKQDGKDGIAYFSLNESLCTLHLPDLEAAKAVEYAINKAYNKGRKQARYELATVLAKVFVDGDLA